MGRSLTVRLKCRSAKLTTDRASGVPVKRSSEEVRVYTMHRSKPTPYVQEKITVNEWPPRLRKLELGGRTSRTIRNSGTRLTGDVDVGSWAGLTALSEPC